MDWPQDKIIVICGATACGKSALALDAAHKTNGVVINADSVQVYQDIPLLAASPTSQDCAQAPHMLYNFLAYDQQLSVGKWLSLVHAAINKCMQNGKAPIVVGGTGMYLRALIEGINVLPESTADIKNKVQQLTSKLANAEIHALLQQHDPQMAQILHINDRQRIMRSLEVFFQSGTPLSHFHRMDAPKNIARSAFYVVCVDMERQQLYNNCDQRFLSMLDKGAVQEVKRLMVKYPGLPLKKGIGVQELASFIKGEIPFSQAVAKAQQATRNYAKRQLTWFRHQLVYDVHFERGEA